MKARTSLSSRSSFTLVEMLVAIAVLSIMMIMVFGLVGTAVKVADITSRGADSGIEARQVLDRIGADIAGMLIRRDVDQFYYKGTGNDKMFFYSQQTGYFPTDSGSVSYYSTNQSPVSLIGYRINSSDNTAGLPTLERLARGLTVDIDGNATPSTGPMQFLIFTNSITNPVTTSPTYIGGAITNQWGASEASAGWTGVGANGDVGSSGGNYDDGASPYYDTIGSQVFRFEVCFQLANGSFSQYPGYINSAPTYSSNIGNTIAIVVAIAVLDSKSRKLVSAAGWGNLTNGTTLRDPQDADLTATPPVLMDSIWNGQLNQSTFATTAGIPAAAASHIKVYQRYYYLNAPKVQ